MSIVCAKLHGTFLQKGVDKSGVRVYNKGTIKKERGQKNDKSRTEQRNTESRAETFSEKRSDGWRIQKPSETNGIHELVRISSEKDSLLSGADKKNILKRGWKPLLFCLLVNRQIVQKRVNFFV